MNRQLLSCGLLVMLFCVGCSNSLPPNKPTVHVSGKVKFANGQPVRFANIFLEPTDPAKGVVASGWIGKDGKFTLRSYSPEEPDGAVKGEYQVRLENFDPGIGVQLPKGETPSVIPDRYLKTATSKLTVQIDDETDNLEFKIDG